MRIERIAEITDLRGVFPCKHRAQSAVVQGRDLI